MASSTACNSTLTGRAGSSIAFKQVPRVVLCRYILESEYGYTVGSNLFLGVVHPSLVKPRLIRVPYLQEEILLMVEDQRAQGKALSANAGPNAAFVLPPKFRDAP